MPYTRKVLISQRKWVKKTCTPTILGELVFKKRQEDGLTQVELGERLGVNGIAVHCWETGQVKEVSLTVLPKLIDYLGFNPEPEPEGIGAKLKWKRRALGWTSEQAAAKYGVAPHTWGKWEKRKGLPAYHVHMEQVREFLDMPMDQAANLVKKADPAPSRPKSSHLNTCRTLV